jgi:hypothetical protein
MVPGIDFRNIAYRKYVAAFFKIDAPNAHKYCFGTSLILADLYAYL